MEKTFESVIAGLTPASPEKIAAHQEQQRANTELLLRGAWGAPPRHVEFTPPRNRVPTEWDKAYLIISAKAGTGFLFALVGTRGNGKTQLGVELMKQATAAGRSAKYSAAMDFFVAIKDTYRKESKLSEKDILATYTRPQLLVVDEFGKRGETEWASNLMFSALDKRYNWVRDTLLIDNRTKAEFIAALGPSLASRMQETGGIIECNWGTFR